MLMNFYMSTGQSQLVPWTELGRELCVKKKYCVRDVEMSRVVVGVGVGGFGWGGCAFAALHHAAKTHLNATLLPQGRGRRDTSSSLRVLPNLPELPEHTQTLPRILQVVSFSTS